MNSFENEFLACMESKNIENIKELLKLGFPVNRHIRRENKYNGNHTYPLIIAIEMELVSIVPLLLSSGANPNCFDSMGLTPLMAACAAGSLSILKLLIEYKADISSRDFFGNTILHISAAYGQLDILKFCIDELKVPVIVKNRRGQTPLAHCVEVQEKAKSLNFTEKLQECVEYL
jgi:FOG: Ankyrin repeat